MKNKNEYDANSIQVIENLDAVRKRPGMYIGSTGSAGLHHLLWEILDNAIDEYLAGYCNKISVKINKDNSCTVQDNGRGIPVDKHESGVSAVELVFTKLHAGGKFGGDSSGYKMSGGLHGVGSSVVNALSSHLYVDIFRDKKQYSIKFENGGRILERLTELDKTSLRGTKINFKPDNLIFSHTIYDKKIITNRLREMTYLNKGLEIVFIDERDKHSETFKSNDGIVDYINFLNKSNNPLHDPVIIESPSNKDMKFQITFQYSLNKDREEILSFANNIKTVDGGQHETGFKNALTKAVNEYCTDNDIFKKNEKKFDGVEIRYGITAIISVYLVEDLLQFEGQTKTKLGTTEIKGYVESNVYSYLKFWLVENKAITIKIIELAFAIRRARESAKQLRTQEKNFNKKSMKQILSGKLVHARSNNPNEIELFLVEGDSAGGSAKLGRDSKIQAILPLKGKVINSEKSTMHNVLSNEELLTVITSIGTDIGRNFNIDNLKYGKIIIMTDADTDGAHIQILLLTFFHKFMKQLIENGNIYIALPPLYKVVVKGKDGFSKYLWNDDQLKLIQEKFGKVEIQRYKGLGEMNYDQLWETTMDPNQRTIIQVTIDDALSALKSFDSLMGNNPALRRLWIEKNIDFEISDSFLENNLIDKE